MVDNEGRWPMPWLREPVREALRRQRGHALLVQGAGGNGTWPFMVTLAQAWLCESGAADAPCGRCSSCRLAHAHAHPDLHLVLPEALRVHLPAAQAPGDDAAETAKGKRKPSKQIRIDEVRAAIDWVTRSSSRGRAKVVVLYPAETMALHTASALLKTLEEPPGSARLVLGASDAGLLLPTVRSRCQCIDLRAPATEQAVAWLAAQGVRDAAVLLAAAGGQPLEARDLAAAGIDAALWQALPRAVAAGRADAVAHWPVPRAVDALQKLCHDALVVGAGGTPRFFGAGTLPSGGERGALLAWARTLAGVARHDEHPWNEGLLLEALVAEGRGCWQDATRRDPGAAAVLATLQR